MPGCFFRLLRPVAKVTSERGQHPEFQYDCLTALTDQKRLRSSEPVQVVYPWRCSTVWLSGRLHRYRV